MTLTGKEEERGLDAPVPHTRASVVQEQLIYRACKPLSHAGKGELEL